MDKPTAEQAGTTVCVNCHGDGTYDVYASPLQPATEAEYPDGLFGLQSIEDALKAVLVLKQGSSEFEPVGHADMMSSYQDGETTRTQGTY